MDSYITSKANTLFDSVISDLDDRVYDIAKEVASGQESRASDGKIEIKEEHVKQAAESVFSAIRLVRHGLNHE